MIREVEAVYRDGVFVPNEPCSLPDRTPVRLIVESSAPDPESGDDAGLRAMLDRMSRANVSPQAFPIQRESLHERR